MSRNVLHAAANACRLDVCRVLSSSPASTVLVLLFAPIFSLLMGLVLQAGDLGSGAASMYEGAIAGACTGLFVVLTTYVFFYESQGHGLWMNGVVPISRAHQVLGRYLFLLVSGGLFVVEMIVCTLIANAMSVAGFGSLWSAENTQSVAVSMVMFLLLEALMYPLLYRFPLQKAITMAFVTVFVLLLVGFFLSQILPDAILVDLQQGADWLVGHVVVSIVIATAVALAALAVSLLCSLRIYRVKEL